MRELSDSTPFIGDAAALRRRLAEHGYLLFRGLFAEEMVTGVRAAVHGTLGDAGWLADDATLAHLTPTPAAVREGAPGYFVPYVGIQSLQEFHELAHQSPVRDLIDGLLGEPVLVHPRKIARTSLPHDDEYTPPHQDFRLIQGSVDTMTVWVPLGDCPVSLGGLRVLEGSHRAGLVAANAALGAGGVGVPVDDDDDRWRTTDYEAGDAILFTSLTVHGALHNDQDSLRLSADFRYQPLAEPVVEGSLLPHYHPQVPDWDVLTVDWSSTASTDVARGVTVVPQRSGLDPDLRAPFSRLLATA